MIQVSRLTIAVGVDAQGRPIANAHIATGGKTLFVEPGKFATIKVVGADGKVKVAEVPLGALGWEYEPI